MTTRDDFIKRIAEAMIRGHAKQRHQLSAADALIRARQVADALPQLFEPDRPCSPA